MLNPHHPYAVVHPGDYSGDQDEFFNGHQQYGRVSPMVSSVGAAPPAVSNVRARAGEVGVSRGGYQEEDEGSRPKNNLIRILTCRCG